jgi:hypothetical protein
MVGNSEVIQTGLEGNFTRLQGRVAVCRRRNCAEEIRRETYSTEAAKLRSVCWITTAFRGLRCHPLTCMSLKIRLNVDSIPSALTILTPAKSATSSSSASRFPLPVFASGCAGVAFGCGVVSCCLAAASCGIQRFQSPLTTAMRQSADFVPASANLFCGPGVRRSSE